MDLIFVVQYVDDKPPIYGVATPHMINDVTKRGMGKKLIGETLKIQWNLELHNGLIIDCGNDYKEMEEKAEELSVRIRKNYSTSTPVTVGRRRVQKRKILEGYLVQSLKKKTKPQAVRRNPSQQLKNNRKRLQYLENLENIKDAEPVSAANTTIENYQTSIPPVAIAHCSTNPPISIATVSGVSPTSAVSAPFYGNTSQQYSLNAYSSQFYYGHDHSGYQQGNMAPYQFQPQPYYPDIPSTSMNGHINAYPQQYPPPPPPAHTPVTPISSVEASQLRAPTNIRGDGQLLNPQISTPTDVRGDGHMLNHPLPAPTESRSGGQPPNPTISEGQQFTASHNSETNGSLEEQIKELQRKNLELKRKNEELAGGQGFVEIGPNLHIPSEKLRVIREKAKDYKKLARNLFRHFFTETDLLKSSLSGRKCNANKNAPVRPKLDENKTTAIIDYCLKTDLYWSRIPDPSKETAEFMERWRNERHDAKTKIKNSLGHFLVQERKNANNNA